MDKFVKRGLGEEDALTRACNLARHNATRQQVCKISSYFMQETSCTVAAPIRNVSRETFVFTDGSCINNGKKHAVGGVGVFFGDGDCKNFSRRYGPDDVQKNKPPRHPPLPDVITNQTMELLAAIYGLTRYIDNKNEDNGTVIVFTDSLYTIKCVTVWYRQWQLNGWRTADGKRKVQNQILIKELLNLIQRTNARFVHVRAHCKEPDNPASREHMLWYGNSKADAAATAAAIS